ncbi:MAG TPA: hypothetical protein VFA90_17185 [Terriglobales bacterium]|nr:hypothetical protein [Terriglobales bacterium]
MSGKSGVGKSQFTAEFVKRRNARPVIRVPCPVPAFDKTVKDGVFIRNLSQQVNEIAASEGFEPIATFANRLGTKAISDEYDRRLLEDARRVTTVAALSALRNVFRRKGKSFFGPDELYRVSATWQPIVHHDYVFCALKGGNATVIIENCQLMDYESLILVQNLVRTLNGTSWLLEYTLTEVTDSYLRTHQEFENLCPRRTKLLVLNPISLDDIVSVSRSFAGNDTTALIEQQYRNHGGNLRVLLDTALIASDSRQNKTFQSRIKHSPDTDATIYRLDSLSHSGLFLLALLLANDGHLEMEVADVIYTRKLPDLNLVPFRDAISFLNGGNLVTTASKEVLIAHDRISDAFAADPARSIVFRLALNASAEFYEAHERLGDHFLLPAREAILRLLKIRLQTNPLMIFAQFNQLRDAVLRSATRNEAETFLRAIKEALQNEAGISEAAWWDLAHLCYEANLHRLAAEISTGRPTTSNWRLLRAFVFHNLDRNEEALLEIEPLFKIKCPTAALLTSLILKMVCLRSLGDFDAARSVARSIELGQGFASEPEYGHFLRNVEFLKGPLEGLASVRDSVKCFATRGLLEEERQARITLAMQLARLGHTKEALAELRALTKRQEIRISDGHILWNDIAVVEMMEGRMGEKQRHLLERSRLTGALDFDRIVTNTNLALWHAHHGDIVEATRLFASIEPLVEAETDSHLRSAVFFNRSAILARAGRAAESITWREKLCAEANLHDAGYKSYWLVRAGSLMCAEEQFAFLLKLPFHYLFLTHWSVPLRLHFEWQQ